MEENKESTKKTFMNLFGSTIAAYYAASKEKMDTTVKTPEEIREFFRGIDSSKRRKVHEQVKKEIFENVWRLQSHHEKVSFIRSSTNFLSRFFGIFLHNQTALGILMILKRLN